MSRNSTRRRVGLGSILIHTLLTFVTGGLWLIVLFIWFLRSNSR